MLYTVLYTYLEQSCCEVNRAATVARGKEGGREEKEVGSKRERAGVQTDAPLTTNERIGFAYGLQEAIAL